MNPERWQQIETLFAATMDRPPAERAAMLDRHCGDDRALRDEVAALLAEDEATASGGEGDPLASSVRHGAMAVIDSAIDPLIGQRVGAWRIVDRLGQGGMSTVYLAVRDDAQFKKRAAIKFIKRGMDSEEILRRFHNERQILASLEHPNVARLIDAGCTDAGLSYFVMEHVEGVPIDRYCDQRRLAIDARLALFRTVCAAVSHAHRNLVVHRDLKPSNILVTDDGTPKLLDFGIAKLLNPELTADRLEPTVSSIRLMTPNYASPEQIRGALVTTASDVFSLGVLLYQLLSGNLPHGQFAGPGDALERRICEAEPPAPSAVVLGESTATSPTRAEIAHQRDLDTVRLVRRLRGDLDTIVLKALRKEPQRRYRSVDHLSDDLERHLDGLPVAAHRNSFRYRAGKYLRRHRVVATAALVGSIVGAAFLVVIGAQALRLAREKEIAVFERTRAETISDALLELFQVPEAADAEGPAISARELLDRGARRLLESSTDKPESQATSMDAIGQVYKQLGLFDQAEPLFERALALRREVYGPVHAEVAASLKRLATLHAEAGHTEKAVPLFHASLEAYRGFYGQEHPETATALANLGLAVHELGDYVAAERLYRESLVIEEGLAVPPKPRRTVRSNLALLLYDQGSYDEATRLYRAVLHDARRIEGADGPEVARLQTELGMTLMAAERLDEAETHLRAALALDRGLYPDPHPKTALTELYLATLLTRQGALAEAEVLHRRSLATRLQVLGPDQPWIADSLTALAETLVLAEKPEEAEAHLRRAIEIYRARLPADHPFAAMALVALGELLLDAGDQAAARPLLHEALAIRRAKLPVDDPRTASAERLLAAANIDRAASKKL